MQAATNVESLSDEAVLDAQFLRELAAFGFEYAKLNPTVLESATENGTEAFLATLWQSDSTQAESVAMRQATGKLSGFFETLDTNQQRVKLLEFKKQVLQFAKQLPPDFQLPTNDSKVVSALVELGGAYAALQLVTEAPSAEDSGFFLNTLFLAGNIEQATQEFRDFLKAANEFTGYRPSITFSAVNGEIFWNHTLDQFDRYVPNDYPTNFVVYRNGVATDDRFASIKIQRADGREEIYPGDQLFRLYIKPEPQITDADQVHLQANEVALYVGDTVFVEDRTILGPLEQIVPVRRIFEVFKLVDRAIVGQTKALWEQINNNKWLTGVLFTTFAGAQLTPAGPVLNALMVLIGGFQAGYGVLRLSWASLWFAFL
ncbi:hypothetical protein [Leptolyngbya sp. 7M]|uniref:hypothetical protein n=1 Tax=Leptolyngbya sp. 7M TaxID=2812896 RepID=UPI001B8D2C09|nr:hypothetical protein [Leptolyngbya sp. 7M]QYO67558.1 hypothetical protein JVX88_12630 [Leptolyngbya sp. 7M]